MSVTLALLLGSGALLLAYAVDIVARRLAIPAVLGLLAIGLVCNAALGDGLLPFRPTLDVALPIIGTLGLILIVLEASLDLEIHRQNMGLAIRAFLAATAATVLLSVGLALVIGIVLNLTAFHAGLLAIPLAVVSSAVAIPAAQQLGAEARDFITYESAFSDIVGVVLFYAWLASEGDLGGFTIYLVGGGVFTVLLSVLFVLGLFILMNRLTGHVRFVPMMAGLLALYATGKAFNLSPLLLVMAFGLFLCNFATIERHIPWLAKLGSNNNPNATAEFKAQVTEVTFAVRSLFFLALGLWIPLQALVDVEGLLWAGLVLATIFLLRKGVLWVARAPHPRLLLWVSPRGLISVLLLLSALKESSLSLEQFPLGAVMWVVIISCSMVMLARPPAAPPNPSANSAANP